MYLEPQWANNCTGAEACLATQKEYLIHLAGCISAYTSFTALSGSCLPRLLMTILSSHCKSSKFAFSDKLEPCSAHDPLETPDRFLQNLVASCVPAPAFTPTEHSHQTSSIFFTVFLQFFKIIFGLYFLPPTHQNSLPDVLQI